MCDVFCSFRLLTRCCLQCFKGGLLFWELLFILGMNEIFSFAFAFTAFAPFSASAFAFAAAFCSFTAISQELLLSCVL